MCLVLGKAHADNDVNYLNLLKYNKPLLIAESKRLCRQAKVNVDSILGCNVIELYKFQKVLCDYSIALYDDRTNGNKILFHVKNGGKNIDIFYLKTMHHFIVLLNVKGFFSVGNQCKNCRYLYQSVHLCRVICMDCRANSPCIDKGIPENCYCIDCNRNFKTRECFYKHKSIGVNGFSICQQISICRMCHKIIDMTHNSSRAHVCNETYCKLCKKFVEYEHKCFVKPHTKKSLKNFNIIFFDLECTQEKPTEKENHFQHVPNLCITKGICEKCFKNDFQAPPCLKCISSNNVFENSTDENCVDKFLNYLEETFAAEKAVCIAHNLKAYDGHFIMAALAARNAQVFPLMVGFKVFKLGWKNISFIDSLNFISMPLSKFSSAFGLTGIAKGYFPHFFNKAENINYIGPLPPKEMYGYEHFNVKDMQEFVEWHDDQTAQNFVFNFSTELKKYCELDVNILKQGCIKFMRGFIETLNVNAFLESTTLAGSVMIGFRKNFLRPNCLAIVPKNNYNIGVNASFIGRLWLAHENLSNNHNIILEHKTVRGGFLVDGYNIQTGVVYEFLGCYYHGCPECFKDIHVRQNGMGIQNGSLAEKYENTLQKIQKLNENNYIVVTMWECGFNKYLKENPNINKRLLNLPEILYGPINIRDAINGGLTEVFRTYYSVKNGEKIRSLDFCSLYPYVNKYCAYPKSHPKIYRGDECLKVNILNIHGIIKCKILPPKTLFHPVLPLKIFDRMVMTLCRTCGENKLQTCSHENNERALVGTWVIAEVQLALEMGYLIVDTFEIWEYEVEIYDNVTKTGGIFTKYMNTFLKLKQESSGWPHENMSEEQKNQYIESFYNAEGIQLVKENICPNPQSRTLAKNCLNSLWGKFIELETRPKTDVFREPQHFLNHVFSGGVEVIEILPFGENLVWVNWKFKNTEQIDPLPHVSLAVGAFTTAYGRIRLYKEILKKLSSPEMENNVALYCDTDSIYYIEKPGFTYNLPIGDNIGELTNELVKYGQNAYITDFVAVGPKSYSYIVLNPDTNETFQIAKCKGISATFTNMSILTFQNFKHLVFDPQVRDLTFPNMPKIKRVKTFQVHTGPESKSIHFTVNKRIVCNDNLTVPYGYCVPRVDE